ncbi:MAG: esterase [Saprospiraceae bacterium]|nr:MAG: esterase [Saprospiraceae bacterium]
MEEHSLKVSRTARYYSLGKAGKHIKNLWIVCHGYGQLASRIIQKFDAFDDGETLIIAPEGLSRFYWEGVTGMVAASWMTKAGRLDEINDYANYLSLLYEKTLTSLPDDVQICLFGFSQGCATQVRWIMEKFPRFHHLILWAGFFPEDLDYLPHQPYFSDKDIRLIYGTEDQFLTPERLEMHKRLLEVNQLKVKVKTFKGKHLIDREELNEMNRSIKELE